MYRENQIEASKKTRPSSAPCSEVPEKRRIEYENRAAELKRELTKQRMVLKMQNLKSTANKCQTCQNTTKHDSDGAKSSIVYENKFGKPKASSTMINYNCERSKNISRSRPATCKILRRCPIVNTKCKVFTNPSKNLVPPYQKSCEPCQQDPRRKKNITKNSDICSDKSKNYFESLNDEEQFLDNCLKNMKHSKETKTMKRKCEKTMYQPKSTNQTSDEHDFILSKPLPDGDDHGFELVERLLEREHVLDKVQIPPRLLPTTNDYENHGAAFDKLNEFFKFIDNVEQQIGEQATKDQSSNAVLDANKRGPISRNDLCITSKDKLKDQINPKCTQTKRTLDKKTSRTKKSHMPEAVTRSGPNRNEMINQSMKKPDECPNKESNKGPIACNPIVAIAQQMIESAISHSGFNKNRYMMLYTCLEWALSQCPSTNDIPLEMRIMNAIMHWGPELDTQAYAAIKPNTIIIKPGEIDPESVTIIKFQEHANTESTHGPEEDDYNIGHDTNLHNNEKSKNCEFNEHYLPETRVVNAVPSSQNPQVAELDMCKARVIRNMEQYMTPLNVMEN